MITYLILAAVAVALLACLWWLATRKDRHDAQVNRIAAKLAGEPAGPTRIWEHRGETVCENDGPRVG